MFKYAAISAAVVILSILTLVIPGKTFYPASTTGSWTVDIGHSDAQFSADGTTDFGKTKTTFTVGVARIAGVVKLNSDSTASTFDFTMYSSASKAPPMNEEGKVKAQWLVTMANHTLVCFHSKGAQQMPDGRLQTTGNLVLTRVDRNVELTPNEAYAGPVYGPPMVHRIVRQGTFIFDAPTERGGKFQTSGTTNVVREDFPQLVKAVTATYWPPVVQDENCQYPAGAGEAYGGSRCTGTLVEAPEPPEAPHAENAEDYPGPSDFNSIVGEHLTIAVHMRLTPSGPGAQAKAGN
jgi:polyisoprenoid-binding protein YceI